MTFTRAQYATAVQAAHDALHDAEAADGLGYGYGEQFPSTRTAAIKRAHEALHRVSSAEDPPIACGTPDPEARAIAADLRQMLASPLPCGHTLGDLIGGDRAVTKCGACLQEKQTGTGRFAPAVLKIWTNGFDTAIAETAEDARRFTLECVGESPGDGAISKIGDWHESAEDPITILNRPTGIKTTRSAVEWIALNGPGFLCSTEY